MKLSTYTSVAQRAGALEKECGVSLTHVQAAAVDDDTAVHCENRIGAITIPLGVAGPLHIMGDYAKGTYFVPLATTEGALVASVSRGMKVMQKGVVSTVTKEGTTRGPVFKVNSIRTGQMVEKWVWDHVGELATEAEKTSHHIKLMDIHIKRVATYLFLRLSFDTDQAMGMNMATIATQRIAEYITRKTKCALVSVAGNFDVDKKPAWLNAIQGRGYAVHAETILSQKEVESIFKVSPKAIYQVWKAKCMIGSALAGSIGFNAHHANIVAAFFAATGQDLAHVVDGSIGMTIVDITDDGSLYGSVMLPDLMIGTVGGVTTLKTQSEARSLLKTHSPYVLAEVLGGAVLAGELSLLASLAEGSLAKAHTQLGR